MEFFKKRVKVYRQGGKKSLFFLKNWWVATYILMAFSLYAEARYQKNQLSLHLKERVLSLKREKERALLEQEQLLLRLNSEEDPDWIELVLKQKLGVVGERERKVIFSKRF